MAKIPNCTHVTMIRVYGPGKCSLCRRQYPAVQWLYACQQDLPTGPTVREILGDVQDSDDSKSRLRKKLEILGFSESVIGAAENGQYTPGELGILEQQKLQLRRVLEQVALHHESADGNELGHHSPSATVSLDGTTASILKQNLTGEGEVKVSETYEEVVKKASVASLLEKGTCSSKYCHSCRPYYKDRIYASFGSVFANDFTPLTREDTEGLKTGDAAVFKAINRAVATLETPLSSTFLFTEPASPDSVGSNTGTTGSSDTSFISTSNGEGEGSTNEAGQADNKGESKGDNKGEGKGIDKKETATERAERPHFYKFDTHKRSQSSRSARGLVRIGYSKWKDSLKQALADVFKGKKSQNGNKEGSSITLPLERTGRLRGIEPVVHDFDLDELKRVRSERRHFHEQKKSEGKVVDTSDDLRLDPALKHTVPVDVDAALDPGVSTIDFANRVTSRYSGDVQVSPSRAPSEAGSEVEVEGGVALLEEAVETRVPDLVDQDIVSVDTSIMAQA